MRRGVGRLVLLCAAAFFAVAGLAFAGSTEQSTPKLKSVSLRLDWLYGAEHAPYFVAQQLGYFKDAGLDVKINEVSVTDDASAELAAGKVDAIVGWTFNEALETTLKGVPTYTLKFDHLGLHVPGSTIIANTSMVKSDPQTVKAFVDAVLRGW